jgi:hypothetical protein
MQGAAWVKLFRRIPPARHDGLVLTTTTGTEIVVQRLIRLDRDFLVALGRLGGTTEHGKILVLPYDHLTHLSFNKKLTDAEIIDFLGKPGVAVQPVEAEPERSLESALVPRPADETIETFDFPADNPPLDVSSDTPLPAEPAVPAVPPGGNNVPKVSPPSKSILLARLRERLANEIAKPPGT